MTTRPKHGKVARRPLRGVRVCVCVCMCMCVCACVCVCVCAWQSPCPPAYLGKVRGVPYPVHHPLALGVHGRHVAPHPVPRDALDGEAGPVHVEENAAVLLLLLPGGPGAVVRGGGGRLVPGAGAAPEEEAVSAGALGAAVPAQLGRGGPGPARGGGSGH